MADKSSEERLLDTYEKLYYFELDRKEKLFTRLPILIAFYSILLGILASYLSNLPQGELYLLILFYSAAVAQIGFLLWSVPYTYRFLFSDDYDYILPDLPEDPVSSEAVSEVVEGLESLEEEDALGQDIARILIDKYSFSILQNFELNKIRNADFFKATNLIILALIVAFIGAFPYFTLREEFNRKAQRVTIDSVLKVKVMPDTTPKQQPDQSTAKPGSGTQSSQVKRDATGLGVYRLRDRDTPAQSKKRGDWKRRK
jgi:hypothetical protein